MAPRKVQPRLLCRMTNRPSLQNTKTSKHAVHSSSDSPQTPVLVPYSVQTPLQVERQPSDIYAVSARQRRAMRQRWTSWGYGQSDRWVLLSAGSQESVHCCNGNALLSFYLLALGRVAAVCICWCFRSSLRHGCLANATVGTEEVMLACVGVFRCCCCCCSVSCALLLLLRPVG